jgi:hypothetical protein
VLERRTGGDLPVNGRGRPAEGDGGADRRASVKPKSRSRLVVALAMPARWIRTVLTATAVTDDTANAKPMPTRASGTISGAIERSETGRVAAQKSPAAISAKPPPSIQRGLTRGSRRELSGSITRVNPWSSTNASEVFSGLNPWIAESRMLEA